MIYMTARQRARQLLAGAIGAAGLAYPACAAVCPKGRNGCPYPGHCFLYTDADANAYCDYTSSASAAPQAPSGGDVSSQTTVSTVAPSPVAEGTTIAPSLADTAGPVTTALAPVSAIIAGLVVFLITTAACFALVRSGRLGNRDAGSVPALAISSLLGLGAGECTMSYFLGQPAYASLFAAVYIVAGTGLAAYAWRSGVVARRTVLVLAGMSALFGFTILAPLMPIEFVGLVAFATGSSPTPGMLGVLAGIALALVAGRAFCGHLCPVGSVQELAYAAPVAKIVVGRPRYLEIVRAGVFVASVAAALSLVNLLDATGTYDFFTLAITSGFAVFVALLAVSTVVYRPICRVLCPFGLLFSLPSHASLLRLGRTSACVDCGRCERACPTGASGSVSSRRECYLCGRCLDACRVPGALAYGSRAGATIRRRTEERDGETVGRAVSETGR
jgi:polyferredoxin